MSAYDEILGSLPVDDLARRLDASPDDVRQAAAAALPALLGGMQANAQQPAGASSLLDALGQHDPGLLDGDVDLDRVDRQDGERIASHVFGDQQEDVMARLGGSPLSGEGVGGALMKKLVPLLAPMVLSWLAKQVLGGGAGASGGVSGPSTPSAAPGGGLQDVLGQVLGAATGGAQGGSGQQAPSSGGIDAGSIIGDLLGGVLGGGRR